MADKKKMLAIAGEFSGNVLSVVGFVGLLWGIYTYWDKPFENIKVPDIKIRPVHEELATKFLKYSDGTPAKYKLMGVEIKNDKDVSDLKLKISNISYIEKWALRSDKISEEEAAKLIASLPTGVVIDRDIYIEMPRIMANGDTTFQFFGITAPDFKPSLEWYNASSATSSVVHGIYPDVIIFKEMRIAVDGPSFYKILFWVFTVPIGLWLMYKRIRMKYSLEEGRLENKSPDNRESEIANDQIPPGSS